jgi:hypothetical protein
MIAALPTRTFDNLANCGRSIRVWRTSTGKAVTVRVVDSCPSCGNDNDVDLSVKGACPFIAAISAYAR